jgi:hypothetical protein
MRKIQDAFLRAGGLSEREIGSLPIQTCSTSSASLVSDNPEILFATLRALDTASLSDISRVLAVVTVKRQGNGLFITHEGIMGLSGGNIHKDDQLVLLNGSRKVVVVRKETSNPGHYRVVAPADVIGVPSTAWDGVAQLEGVEDISLV